MAEYIERDKVLDAILQLTPKMDEQGYRWLGRMGVWQMLSDFPSADVQPVKHGKWIADGDGYHWTYNCSICGWKDGYPFNERHNYCPNCGARMDGET